MSAIVSDRLKRAAASYGSGDLAAARAQAEAALAAQPESPAALQFLGVIYCQTGDLERGTQLFRKALDHDPGNSGMRVNLAKALCDLGDFDGAYQVAAGQSGSSGAVADLQRLAGDIRKAQGRFAESIAAYERSLQIDPNSFETWNNLGNAHLEAGHCEAAIEAFERARALAPAAAVVRLNLGKALAAAGRDEEALAEMQQAATAAPSDSATLLELGRALNQAGRSAEAIAPLADAARADRANPDIFVALGLAFAALGEFERAEQAYVFALQADRDHPAALLNLGVLLEQSNRVEELGSLVAGAVDRGGEGPEIDCLRALWLRREGRYGEALELVKPIESPAIDERMKAQLVAQLADRTGDVDLAFAAYTEMNEAMARDPLAREFDGSEHRQFVEALARTTTAEWIAGCNPIEIESEPPSPIFLVGFPRSGTTLLDTILMGHSRTHVVEEQPMLARVLDELGGIEGLAELDSERANALRRRYFEELDSLAPPPPGALVVDKLPLNIMRLPLIHRLFPDARIIFAQRHPCDVVLSCFMQNFKINRAMASFLTLENSARLYDRVLAYWQQCNAVMPLRVHTVCYEAMVEDLEGEVRPLLDFLGLPWEDAVLDYQQTAAGRGYIRTPSYAQVTEKVYARASGRWRRYERHLQPVLPFLQPWAERLGYGSLEDAGE